MPAEFLENIFSVDFLPNVLSFCDQAWRKWGILRNLGLLGKYLGLDYTCIDWFSLTGKEKNADSNRIMAALLKKKFILENIFVHNVNYV